MTASLGKKEPPLAPYEGGRSCHLLYTRQDQGRSMGGASSSEVPLPEQPDLYSGPVGKPQPGDPPPIPAARCPTCSQPAPDTLDFCMGGGEKRVAKCAERGRMTGIPGYCESGKSDGKCAAKLAEEFHNRRIPYTFDFCMSGDEQRVAKCAEPGRVRGIPGFCEPGESDPECSTRLWDAFHSRQASSPGYCNTSTKAYAWCARHDPSIDYANAVELKGCLADRSAMEDCGKLGRIVGVPECNTPPGTSGLASCAAALENRYHDKHHTSQAYCSANPRECNTCSTCRREAAKPPPRTGSLSTGKAPPPPPRK
jgi:hypothetical protein